MHTTSKYHNHLRGRSLRVLLATFGALLALLAGAASAATFSIDFESYANGTVNGQDGWSSLGAAGSGCAVYDHQIADNTFGYASFGAKSLRMSNAVTSGCFSDQTFSKSLSDEAGETSAENGGLSGGTRQSTFEAQWSFASTDPNNEQPGLSVVASPDRGDGARMSWVQMTDTPGGLEINFNDYQKAPGPDDFVQTQVASGLDRSKIHTIKIVMIFVDGPANDIVKVYVDGSLEHTGTSWEDYFRDQEGNPTRTVDSILFRTGGAAAPANAGKGFLIDNLTLTSSTVAQCTTDCYVDPNGDDSNGGASASDAKKTIQAAVNQVSPNGTVHIAAGTYNENVTVAKDGLTLSGASKATTILQSSNCTGDGITLSGSRSGFTLEDLSVAGFSSGIFLGVGSDTQTNITIEDVDTSNNCVHGIYAQAGVYTNMIVNRVTALNNGSTSTNGRGIWVINGIKSKISITNGTFSGNKLTGIDFGDGNVSDLTITGNTVENNGDAGISVLGAKGGANLVGNNTVRNNGRFGIEIKVSNGNGADSGSGSVVVSGNVVTRSVAATDARDHAGIAVIRRSGQAQYNDDQPSGVVVMNNEVRGYHRKPSGSTGDGFGIVVEGTGHVVKNNLVTDNDVGIQVQGGNTANTQSTDFFDRGDAAQGSALAEHNSIAGNGIGLRSVGTANNATLDAEQNWWGSNTGPTNAGNPSGTGDSVVGTIDFDPWLCSGQDTSANVGFQPNPQTSPCAAPTDSLTVTKYNDLDKDGGRDSGEPGLSGWAITVKQGNTTVASGNTGADGSITFASLAPGSYTVCETLQGGWQNTDPSNGSGCKTTTITAGNSATVLLGNAATPATCKVFAVNEVSSSDSQFFSMTLGGSQPVFAKIGGLSRGYNIESLALHPVTGVLYAASGDQNKFNQKAALYAVNTSTGALTLVGKTGFKELEALSFNPATNVLWGWGYDKGLVTLNPSTGAATVVFSSKLDAEGMAWNANGTKLYVAAGKTLYSYDPATKKLTTITTSMPGKVESLSLRPDGLLAVGVDGSKTLFAYDPVAKKEIKALRINTPYKDIEGLAWPAGCGSS